MDRKEQAALALSMDRKALRKRLNDAKSCLKTNYRIHFKGAVFDFEGKKLVSKDRCFLLQWSLRNYPDEKESYHNQQTTRGAVTLYEVTGMPREEKR